MIIYGAIAAGVIIAALSGVLWVQTERLDIAQGRIENCEKENEILGKSVIKQNRAVKEWEDTAAKRQKQAKAALAKALEGQGSLDAEIARLRMAKPADCAAGVQTVKKGLKP